MSNNLWRCVFVSTLTHFGATYKDPWFIPDTEFTSALQVVWNAVYKDIKHNPIVGGPVYYVAFIQQTKQNLNDWRAGFAAAAIIVLTTFFATDADFNGPESRIYENQGLDKKNWSGLWRAPFILQTFAHHFNFIQGHIEITEFGTGLPQTALALSCAAVCRALTLVANNNITFVGWLATTQKGSQFEFNENVWGSMTRRFLQPIAQLSDDQFSLVVHETRVYVKKGTTPTSLESEDDDAFDNLFAFR
ncbi:hypothetical protein J3R82DRAFT_10662 [Butyriboletus roseoflavus]|nr:hypothetical protein J3R82DRAFT_10662 [Butyriboletus roseoflavus]